MSDPKNSTYADTQYYNGLTKSQLQAQIQNTTQSIGLSRSQLQSQIESGQWQPASSLQGQTVTRTYQGPTAAYQGPPGTYQNPTTTTYHQQVVSQPSTTYHQTVSQPSTTYHQQVVSHPSTTYHQQVVSHPSTTYVSGSYPSQHLAGQVVNNIAHGDRVVAEDFGVESRIEYIPFSQTYKDEVEVENVYEMTVPKEIIEFEEVVRVEKQPVEKFVTDYYAVETQIDYIQQEIEEIVMVERKVERTDYRVQYIPVEIEIVHYPQTAGGEVVSTRLLENEARVVNEVLNPKGTFEVSRSSAVVGQTVQEAVRQGTYNYNTGGNFITNSQVVSGGHLVSGGHYTTGSTVVPGGHYTTTNTVVPGGHYTTGSTIVPGGTTTTYKSGGQVIPGGATTTYSTVGGNYANQPVSYATGGNNVYSTGGFTGTRVTDANHLQYPASYLPSEGVQHPTSYLPNEGGSYQKPTYR